MKKLFNIQRFERHYFTHQIHLKYPSVKLCVYKYFNVKRSIKLQMRKDEWEEDDKCEIINVDVL